MTDSDITRLIAPIETRMDSFSRLRTESVASDNIGTEDSRPSSSRDQLLGSRFDTNSTSSSLFQSIGSQDDVRFDEIPAGMYDTNDMCN